MSKFIASHEYFSEYTGGIRLHRSVWDEYIGVPPAVIPLGVPDWVILSIANDHGQDVFWVEEWTTLDASRCYRCANIVASVDTVTINDESYCDNCADCMDYATCDRCGDNTTESSGVGYDEHACQDCTEWYTYWCDYCDERYWEGNGYEHEHNRDESYGCCSSPMQTFTMPTPDGPLAQDEMRRVTLDGGIIPRYGLLEVATLLTVMESVPDDQRFAFRNTAWQVGDEYKTDKGTYAKRLRSHIYRTFDVALDPKVVEQIGNLARMYSKGAEVEVAVTRDLDLSAEDFAHEDSCWWTDHSYSRCTLKSNAGFGLRSFGEYGVTGRAWVYPCAVIDGEMVPTFGTPDAYVVFNAYGDLEEQTAARVWASITGMSVGSGNFYGNDVMYVNGNSCYIVAPEDMVDDLVPPTITRRHADLPVPAHA